MATARSPIVAPSILSANLGCLEAEIQSVVKAGADWIHVDVMDGNFVPPITFGDNVVAVAKRACSLTIDVHLMVCAPERHVGAFARAGADRITVHQEVSPHLHRVLTSIREAKCECGIALNPSTPVTTIYDVLDITDMVLIMTVNPGWGGQSFIPASLAKISTLRAEIQRRNLSTRIAVDGGIDPKTAPGCVAAGADALIAGSYIFSHSSKEDAIRVLRKG